MLLLLRVGSRGRRRACRCCEAKRVGCVCVCVCAHPCIEECVCVVCACVYAIEGQYSANKQVNHRDNRPHLACVRLGEDARHRVDYQEEDANVEVRGPCSLGEGVRVVVEGREGGACWGVGVGVGRREGGERLC